MTWPKLNIRKVINSAAIILAALLFVGYCDRQEKIDTLKQLNEDKRISESKAKIYRDKLNRLVVENQSLKGSIEFMKKDFKKSLSAKDSIISDLIKSSDKNTIAAVEFKGQISVNKTIVRDTFKVHDTIINKIPYREDVQYKDYWVNLQTFSSRDSSKFHLGLKYKYSAILEERKRFLKKPETFAKITNYNPYTDTTGMQLESMVPVDAKPKLRGVYFVAGSIFVILVKFLLSK